ncbi:hypothetical protein ACU686_45100 [Yinghuangia aomiensis]
MAVVLAQGARVALGKDGEELGRVHMGLGWDPVKHTTLAPWAAGADRCRPGRRLPAVRPPTTTWWTAWRRGSSSPRTARSRTAATT